MLNDIEKEELRRIINKFVQEGRCIRPIHPDQVMQEVKDFKQNEKDEEGDADGSESAELTPRFGI